MNTCHSSFVSRVKRSPLAFRAIVVFAALGLFAGLMPATAQARDFGGRGFIGGRGFVGGRGFIGGLGFGLGVGLGQSLFYPNYYVYQPGVVTYSSPTPVYYYYPQNTVTVYSPAPVASAPTVAAPAPAPVAPAPVSSSASKLSKILYDASGKPIGVLVLNNDGSQEFVPLVQ